MEDKKKETIASEGEVALLAISATLIELLFAADVANVEIVDKVLRGQSIAFLQSGHVKASGMIELVRSRVCHPDKQALRESQRKFARQRPEGSS